MDFPLNFHKWGTDFVKKKILKKPNTPDYAQVLVVMCLKPNSVAALLSPLCGVAGAVLQTPH